MNLRTLWYFLTTASVGGISAAARQLGLAQSTLSGAVKSLEAEIGTALFEHTPVGLRPTVAGLHLREYSAWLLMETEQAFRDLQSGSPTSFEPVDVLLYGIPSSSAAAWAAKGGVLASVAQGGSRATFVTSGTQSRGRNGNAGIAIRYRLERSCDTHVHAGASGRVRDQWAVLALRGTTGIDGDIAWEDLAAFRLITPSMLDAFEQAWGGTSTAIKPEAVQLEEAGAPYTLMNRKDSALLVPSSSLPPNYTAPGVHVLRVRGAPIAPVIEIEAVGEETLRKLHLLRSIQAELEHLAQCRRQELPRLRTLEARVDLHTLRCFSATMETGNTARAAQACFIVQPALSGQIRKLEKAISSQLFSRSPAGMMPTAAGRRLHALIEPVLKDHVTAMERLRERRWSGHAKGRVRLGIIPAANENSLIAEGAADALTTWRSAFPDVPISVAEGYTSVLLRWLRTHLIDLAIIDTTENQPGLQLMPIFREAITLVFAPGSRWDTGVDAISGAALAGDQLVIPSKRFGLRALFDKAFNAAGVTIEPGLEVDSMAIALRLVRSGQWATILPPSAVHRQLREGTLRQRLLIAPSIERRICAATRNRSNLPPETSSLLGTLDIAFRMHSSNLQIAPAQGVVAAVAHATDP